MVWASFYFQQIMWALFKNRWTNTCLAVARATMPVSTVPLEHCFTLCVAKNLKAFSLGARRQSHICTKAQRMSKIIKAGGGSQTSWFTIISEEPQNLSVALQVRCQMLSSSLGHLKAIMLHQLLGNQGRVKHLKCEDTLRNIILWVSTRNYCHQLELKEF